MEKYPPSTSIKIIITLLPAVVILLANSNITSTYAEIIAKNCQGCVNNTSTQVLTIFNFQTEDTPFLAGNATFIVFPNPYAHTTNSTDYLDLTTWFNFVVSDNDKFDSDPTLGIIEIAGVNNGTYSITQIKGSPGFGMAPHPEASDEIFGTTGYSHITQTFVNFSATTSATIEPPLISDTVLNMLQTAAGGAKINGVAITSANDLPAANMVNKNQKKTVTPPKPVVFTSGVSSGTSTSSLYSTLGIPTYSAPTGLAVSDQSVFTPPIFVAPISGGGKFLMSPMIDQISPGTNMMLRYDNVDQGSEHPLLSGIELPMNTYGSNVGVNVMASTSNPTGVAIPSGNVNLYLDVQSTGDVDFGDSTVYSTKPTVYFNLAKDGFSCPTGVAVMLLTSGHWHEVTPAATHESSEDTTHTCAYSIGVDHFSSYVIASSSTGSHDHDDHADHTDHIDHEGHTEHSGHGGHTHGGGEGHEGHMDAYTMITMDLNIYEIKYDLAAAIARITIGTTGDINDVEVKIFSEQGGKRIAHLVKGQPQIIQVMSNTMKKYVFEVPLDPHETFFRVYVDDRNYNLAQTVDIAGTVGTIIPWFASIHDEHMDVDGMDHMGHGSDSTNTAFEMKFDGGKKTMTYNGMEFPIKYEMAGNIVGLEVDENSRSVTFLLDSVAGGELSLQIPRSLVDAPEDNFVVLVTASPQTEIDYHLMASTQDHYTIMVSLPSGVEKLTIVGASVVPEFGVLASLVLLVALCCTTACLRQTKTSSNVQN